MTTSDDRAPAAAPTASRAHEAQGEGPDPARMADVLRRLQREKPQLHGGGQRRWDVSLGTLEALARMASRTERTLEVGCGVSTIVFAAAGTSHVAISPAPDEFERILQYCAAIGVDTRRVDFRQGSSAEVLPALDDEFDLALIDGAHSFPHPVVDFHYVSRLLRPGGVLLLDDVPIPSVGLVYRFLVTEPGWELLELIDDRAAAFRLRGSLADGDPWGEQAQNASYPDYSFLPLGRRIRVEAVGRLARSQLMAAARRRFPRLDRLAPRLRRWVT